MDTKTTQGRESMAGPGSTCSALLGRDTGDSRIYVVHDDVSTKLDELADLCEYWRRWRARGVMPSGVRAALIMVAREVIHTADMEQQHGPRTQAP